MKIASKIVFVFLLYTFNISAQPNNLITITGKVVDKETKTPLENVNIFLANTTIGVTSDPNGNFIIKNVPYGSYSIIFSYLGFETESRDISSYRPYIVEINIALKQKTIDLNQVNVTGSVPEDWKENLELFTKIFIGETENAKETTILNPEVLNFVEEKDDGAIKAYSDSVLKVENRALGYMLYIVLDSIVYVPEKKITYKFFPRFEELKPVSEQEKQMWDENREKTYLDSPRHFYYALVHNKLAENYFTLHDSPGMGAISPSDLNITCDRDSTVYILNYRGQLQVKTYMSNPSTLNFLFPSVTIDKYGNLITYFYSVETYGYWAKQRIADILPRDYIYPANR